MPAGLYGLSTLMKKKSANILSLKINAQHFMKIFTLLPLFFFGSFSLCHSIKFNWIGPGLLALIPWLAIYLSHSPVNSFKEIFNLRNSWIITSGILLICYGLMITSVISGKPEVAQNKIFKKLLDWQSLTYEINGIAQKIEKKEHSTPIIIPLDVYNINSELTFYQDKLFKQKRIKKIYSLVGQHVFGDNSLMYKYWPHESPEKRLIILVSDNYDFINRQTDNKKLTRLTDVKKLYAYSKGTEAQLKPFFYRTAWMQRISGSHKK